MAEEGGSDYIEGFNAGGKSLDRITQQSQLHDLLKQTTTLKAEVETELAGENDELQKLQNLLNHVNDEFLKKTQELEGMRRKQQVNLDNSRKTTLAEVMRGTLDNYLERRPQDPEETRSVHVTFLTGEEVGSELHVGREGAGSRDATFIVTLSQTVQSLAVQAAKYWGLDPEKVFFLDRDGRIVQGKMLLSDIILPPLDPEIVEAQQEAAAAAGAIVPAAGGAVALPGSAAGGAQPEDQIASYTVKGRDYRLTLVRAKTVLTKEDLSQPKGEKWNDFTFDAKRLNEDLENTRKKRGDPDPQEMKVSMDSIPSLYDLIKQGNLRKFQKNADKWCRIIELGIFLIMWFLFTLLLKPNSSWGLSMNMAATAIKDDITIFNMAEQHDTGILNFSQITERHQYVKWMEGPFRRAVLGGLEVQNIHVLKVQARVFSTPPELHDFDLPWCADDNSSDANSSNSSNVTDPALCYPTSLKQCISESAVEILAEAIRLGQKVPECRPQFTQDPFVTSFKSLYSVDAFSYIAGEISSYLGGKVYDINITNHPNFVVSIADILPKIDETIQPPAQLINVLSFLPSQSGIYLSQYLTEFTPGGPLVTSQREEAIGLDHGTAWEVILFQVCIVLSITCLLLELRRITGWPKKCFFEEKKETCGICTGVFVIVPILLLVSFTVLLRKMGQEFDVLKLSDHTLVENKEEQPLSNVFPPWLVRPEPYQWSQSEKQLYDLQLMIWLENSEMVVNLINFTFMMFLSFRYFLVYFPEMRYITLMIGRAAKPVLVALLVVVFNLLGFACMFYMIFSDQQYEFRNWLVTTMAVLQFAHGGFLNWQHLYEDYKWTWYFLMIAAFLIFTLNLNNILIAILVSHKKEAELHKNYSSHPFWQTLHRQHMQSEEKGELNPALAGFDFGNPPYKDGPKQVTEKPGQKI